MTDKNTQAHPQSEEKGMSNTTDEFPTAEFYALLALAEAKEDAEETLYAAELLLLREIAKTSSDLVKAREWEEFREASGGMVRLEKAHRAAVGAWEQWHFYRED